MAAKINTLIVDDEPLARDRVKRFLCDEHDIKVIGECGNGREASAAIREQRPELIFLDIQMPEKNGFEVVKALDEKSMPAVIFVTAYDQYALQAFDVHALDYLLKPFNRDRLHKAVAHARDQIATKRIGNLDERLSSLIADLKAEKKYLERLVVKSVGRVFFLKVDEIDWIEAAGNYVKLHSGRDSHMIRETMNGIEASSRSRFMPALARRSVDPAMAARLRQYAETHLAVGARGEAEAAAAEILWRARVAAERLPGIDAWLEERSTAG